LPTLRSEWRTEWKHKPLTTAAGPSDAPAPHLRPRPRLRPRLRRAGTHAYRCGKALVARRQGGDALAGLLRRKAVAAPAPAATPERDELEE